METKIKATWRENSQLSELEKGKTTKVIKKYSKLSITGALKTAKQRLITLPAQLRRYIKRLGGPENKQDVNH